LGQVGKKIVSKTSRLHQSDADSHHTGLNMVP